MMVFESEIDTLKAYVIDYPLEDKVLVVSENLDRMIKCDHDFVLSFFDTVKSDNFLAHGNYCFYSKP
jgi:hypothetical protein